MVLHIPLPSISFLSCCRTSVPNATEVQSVHVWTWELLQGLCSPLRLRPPPSLKAPRLSRWPACLRVPAQPVIWIPMGLPDSHLAQPSLAIDLQLHTQQVRDRRVATTRPEQALGSFFICTSALAPASSHPQLGQSQAQQERIQQTPAYLVSALQGLGAEGLMQELIPFHLSDLFQMLSLRAMASPLDPIHLLFNTT